MTNEEVFELIHRNGIGEDIQCSFISKGINNKDYVSIVSNYKYQKGEIKIYVDRYHMREHEKNLAKKPYGELLIHKDESKRSISLRLFCKIYKIEDRFIHAKALNVKYPNDENIEVTQRILSN